jgi:hypothetical protein
MQQSSNPFRREAVAVTLAIFLASCDGDRWRLGEYASPPARLVELSGEPAARLARYEPAEPVLVARADERVVAVVFSEDQAAIPGVLDRLLVSEVPGCSPEGAVACCDAETGTFALNTEKAWIRTGERCEPSDAEEGVTSENPYDPDEPGVAFVSVEPALSQVLKNQFGIDYPYMQLAERDGTSRALVNGPLPGAELGPPPIMRPAGLQGSWQTIPAAHMERPPAGDHCVSRVSYCDRDGSKRCRKRWRHWYYKDRSSGEWCEMPGECRC